MKRLLLGLTLVASIAVLTAAVPSSQDTGTACLLNASIKASVSGGGCGKCEGDCKSNSTPQACTKNTGSSTYTKISWSTGEECVAANVQTTCKSETDGNCKTETTCNDDACSQGCSTSGSGAKHKCTTNS